MRSDGRDSDAAAQPSARATHARLASNTTSASNAINAPQITGTSRNTNTSSITNTSRNTNTSGATDAAWPFDCDAQARLVARVRALLGPRARRAGESLDFAQQAWLELLQHEVGASAFASVNDEESLLRRLCAIARNNVRDAARRKGVLRLESVFAQGDALVSAAVPHAQDLLEAQDSSPSLRLVRREEHERIEQRVNALDPQLRAVFELRARAGLSFPQIAARLARQEDTVRKAYYRAVQALQRGDPGGESPR